MEEVAVLQAAYGFASLDAFARTPAGAGVIAAEVAKYITSQILASASSAENQGVRSPFTLSDDQQRILNECFPGADIPYVGLKISGKVTLLRAQCFVAVEEIIRESQGVMSERFPVVVYSSSSEHVAVHGESARVVAGVQDVVAINRAMISFSSCTERDHSSRYPVGVSFRDTDNYKITRAIFDCASVPTNLAQMSYNVWCRREIYDEDIYIPPFSFLVPFDKSVLVDKSGEIKSLGLRYERTSREIRFYSEFYNVVFSWRDYREMVTVSVFENPDIPGFSFVVDQQFEHPGLFVGKVDFSPTVDQEIALYRSSRLTSREPDVVVTSVGLKGGHLIDKKIIVEREIFDRIYEIVLTLSPTNFSVEAVRQKIALATQVVVVRGRTFKLREAMDMEDLASVATAIYVQGFIEKFEISQAMNVEIQREMVELKSLFGVDWSGKAYRLLMLGLIYGSGLGFASKLITEAASHLRSFAKRFATDLEFDIAERINFIEIVQQGTVKLKSEYPNEFLFRANNLPVTIMEELEVWEEVSMKEVMEMIDVDLLEKAIVTPLPASVGPSEYAESAVDLSSFEEKVYVDDDSSSRKSRSRTQSHLLDFDSAAVVSLPSIRDRFESGDVPRPNSRMSVATEATESVLNLTESEESDPRRRKRVDSRATSSTSESRVRFLTEPAWSTGIRNGRPILFERENESRFVTGYWLGNRYAVFEERPVQEFKGLRNGFKYEKLVEGTLHSVWIVYVANGLEQREHVPFYGLYKGDFREAHKYGLSTLDGLTGFFNVGVESPVKVLTVLDKGIERNLSIVPTSDICIVVDVVKLSEFVFEGEVYKRIKTVVAPDKEVRFFIGRPHGLGTRATNYSLPIEYGVDFSPMGFSRVEKKWVHVHLTWDYDKCNLVIGGNIFESKVGIGTFGVRTVLVLEMSKLVDLTALTICGISYSLSDISLERNSGRVKKKLVTAIRFPELSKDKPDKDIKKELSFVLSKTWGKYDPSQWYKNLIIN